MAASRVGVRVVLEGQQVLPAPRAGAPQVPAVSFTPRARSFKYPDIDSAVRDVVKA